MQVKTDELKGLYYFGICSVKSLPQQFISPHVLLCFKCALEMPNKDSKETGILSRAESKLDKCRGILMIFGDLSSEGCNLWQIKYIWWAL